MHFKAYQIDDRLLRSDSANFSPSGLKRQDNDLVVINGGETADMAIGGSRPSCGRRAEPAKVPAMRSIVGRMAQGGP